MTGTAPSVATARHAHVAALLGETTASALFAARVLVVGAGGIGCELLKNLAMVGLGAQGSIDIIDLDTIDLSNLNRQFLFQKQHIGQPKALVARDTVLQFHPGLPLSAHHDTIFAPQYGFEWVRTFDVVLNALDNLEARKWVNRLCVATRTPLIESGTTGFFGQVQPIIPFHSECYDCTAKPTPKTYPVCTIRSTPSQPIHVIVWAKNWLLPQLFGADEDTEEQELQKALANGENAEEISKLQAESGELKAVRDGLQQPGAAERLFNKLYVTDVQRLLARETMWKTRAPPTPLDWDAAHQQFPDKAPTAQGEKSSLKDHQSLGLKQTVDLFESSLSRLTQRQATDPEPITFDKDDDDVMDFVTASANLRGWVYNIPRKTRFETKEMAGNIIPAIASTNAIIAAQIVAQAVNLLSSSSASSPSSRPKDSSAQEAKDARSTNFVHLTRSANRLVSGSALAPPNPLCPTCAENYGLLTVRSMDTTLSEIVEAVVRPPPAEGGLGIQPDPEDEESVLEIGLYSGTRLLVDVDMDENLPRSLDSLQVVPNTILTITDEQDEQDNEEGQRPWAATNLFIRLDPHLSEKIKVSHLDTTRLKRKPARSLAKPPDEGEDSSDSDVESVGVAGGEEDIVLVERPSAEVPARKTDAAANATTDAAANNAAANNAAANNAAANNAAADAARTATADAAVTAADAAADAVGTKRKAPASDESGATVRVGGESKKPRTEEEDQAEES